MKLNLLVTRIVWAIAIPLLVISSTVSICVGSLALYQYGFEKYNISRVTHISYAQLEEAGIMMASYLGGQRSTPQVTVTKNGKESPLYNEKELTHLDDVRKITDIFRILLVASLIVLLVTGILLIANGNAIQCLRGIRDGSIISLCFTGVLVIWALFDFDSLFYLFHILSFNNDLWLLDPTRDYLIMMFPQDFFNDAAMLIVGTIILISALLLVSAIVLEKRMGRNQAKE